METCQVHTHQSPAGTLTARVRALIVMAFVGAFAAGLGGCNAGGTNLLEANRALQERVTALTAQNESLNNTNQQLQAALAARDKAIAELQALVADLRSGTAGWSEKYQELLGRLPRGFGTLDPETDSALRELAAQHPDLIEYVPELGLLRFKSDVTFASGSDQVNASARSTLQQLASILNGAARNYDVKVLGHTDSQPVVRARAQHPTNMHLSAHRAISVRNELVNMGVEPARFEVAGRGEFDPLVPNTASGNTPRNRRVEVYLTKPTGRALGTGGPDTGMGSSTPAPAPAATPRRSEEIMK